MNFLETVQRATDIFLKHAYPGGTPETVSEKVRALKDLKTQRTLFNWDGLEREGTRYNLRLGNENYPHMKLVFMVEGGDSVFYVDAHDSHFNLPPNMPGYDKLLALRKKNQSLKAVIEKDWSDAGLNVFGAKPTSMSTNRKVGEGLKIIAIDDEPQILSMLSIIMSQSGAMLHTATSAKQARTIIEKEGEPDLILCDIMMQDESGYDFVSWLRNRGFLMPIYFITGLNMDSIDKTGVTSVLQKPFTAKSVLRILKAVKKGQV